VNKALHIPIPEVYPGIPETISKKSFGALFEMTSEYPFRPILLFGLDLPFPA
jgi:hypothetical protein